MAVKQLVLASDCDFYSIKLAPTLRITHSSLGWLLIVVSLSIRSHTDYLISATIEAAPLRPTPGYLPQKEGFPSIKGIP